MTTDLQKKIFFCMFCLASVLQGMYSTYFVSILTTIERIYQIQSKTAGAILSATETGQILGSLIIAYYGGKGNKPKWIAACMTLTALAALMSISPHFLLRTTNHISLTTSTIKTTTEASYNSNSDLITTTTTTTESTFLANNLTQSRQQTITSHLEATIAKQIPQPLKLPTRDQLCLIPNNLLGPNVLNSTFSSNTNSAPSTQAGVGDIYPNLPNNQQNSTLSLETTLVIFFFCLLAIGFGSTAITTLGIPFIDDIVSKEESPLYLGLTIGLKIFGPALGFLLGSFCIRLNSDFFTTIIARSIGADESHIGSTRYASAGPIDGPYVSIGAWWLGPVIISIPLLILALPMYYLSRLISNNDHKSSDFEGITYQAAEDHDIGGSRDFQTHVLTVCDLDVTSNQTCYSEFDSSSREVLQAGGDKSRPTSQYCRYNFRKNLTLGQPIITRESIMNHTKLKRKSLNEPLGCDEEEETNINDNDDSWKTSCLVVNQFGRLESTSFINEDVKSLQASTSSESSSSVPLPSPTPSYASSTNGKLSTTDLFGSLSRLIKNRLLLLRMLSAILHILPIAGFYTFLPKYLSEQFRIDPSSASAISGLAGILFVGIGAFGGGTIVRVLNVNSKIMTKWIASSALLYAMGMFVLMNLGCNQNQTVYHGSPDFITTDCLINCRCSSSIFSPVCANGTTYISPCLAGCKSYTISEDRIIYDECGCSSATYTPSPPIDGNNSSGLLSLFSSASINSQNEPNSASRAQASDHLNLNVATQGHCLLNCDNLIWYIVTFSIFTLIHASCEVGSMMFNLRCVQTQDRTLALGLITFSSSLFGTIPCSVIYGTMIDLTCVHWASLVSETKGACQAYENTTFRYYLHGVTGLVMFLAFLVDCVVYRYSEQVDFYSNNNQQLDRHHQQHHHVKKDSKQDISSVHKESIETI